MSQRGVVSRMTSPQVAEVDGVPYHVRNLRHRGVDANGDDEQTGGEPAGDGSPLLVQLQPEDTLVGDKREERRDARGDGVGDADDDDCDGNDVDGDDRNSGAAPVAEAPPALRRSERVSRQTQHYGVLVYH